MSDIVVRYEDLDQNTRECIIEFAAQGMSERMIANVCLATTEVVRKVVKEVFGHD